MEKFTNVDELVRRLREAGIKSSSNIVKSLNDLAFRILEQVRLGNKENVYYMLLRIYKSNQERIPEVLAEAFQPCHNVYFKTLIYSFLSPILERQDVEGGGQ